MHAHVQITMVVPKADLEDRLLDFLRLVKKQPGRQAVRRSAGKLDPSATELLRRLPAHFFWPALKKLQEFSSQRGKDGAEFELDFSPVDYPYANIFGTQFENWMRAIGCRDVASDVRDYYTRPTASNLLNVRREYQEGTLALFVGAGLSTEFNLPLWAQLQERLIQYWTSKDAGNHVIADKLRGRDFGEQARWLKNELGPEFAQSVKQALYRDLYQHRIPISPTVKSIAKMKNVRAICTYNFDDLLERQAGRKFKTVASSRDGYCAKEIPVYHVHGVLPYLGSPRGDLILAEDAYHVLTNNPLHWANIVQFHLLRECTCLLIGLSCDDPNLRRILDAAKGDKAGATYLIKKMEALESVDRASVKTWSQSKEFDRDRFADIGVRTIWINNHDEIASILDECRKKR